MVLIVSLLMLLTPSLALACDMRGENPYSPYSAQIGDQPISSVELDEGTEPDFFYWGTGTAVSGEQWHNIERVYVEVTGTTIDFTVWLCQPPVGYCNVEVFIDSDMDPSTGQTAPPPAYNDIGADYAVGVEIQGNSILGCWIDACAPEPPFVWVTVGNLSEVQFSELWPNAITFQLSSTVLGNPTAIDLIVCSISDSIADNIPNYGHAHLPLTAVEPENIPPVADVNGPYEGLEGSNVTLDASGSTDPDGEIVSYRWDLDGDAVYDIETESPVLEVIYSNESSLVITLEVTDDDGLSSTASVEITIHNVAPTVEAGPPRITATVGRPVNFYGNATDPGVDDILTYVWHFGDGEWAQGQNVTHSYQQEGEYSAQLVVTDDSGATGGDTIIVEIVSKTYHLDVRSSPSGITTIAGAGYYAEDRAVELIAGLGPFNLTPPSVGKRYLFWRWRVDGEDQPEHDRTVVVDIGATNHVAEAICKLQYRLTVQSERSVPAGGGWYWEGETASFSLEATEAPVGGILGRLGVRDKFVGWSDDSTATTQSATIEMNEPKTVTAVWETDYSRLYFVTALLLGGLGAPMGFWATRRRRFGRYLATPLCPPDDGEAFTATPEFLWTETQIPGASYNLKLWEARPGIKPDSLTELPPYFEAENIRGASFTYPDDAPPLLFGESYVWEISSVVEGKVFPASPVLFNEEKATPEEELQKLLEHLEEIREKIKEAGEDVKSNPLVQEAELIKAIGDLLRDYDDLDEKALEALKAFTQCKDGSMAELPQKSFELVMTVLQAMIKLILIAGDLKPSQENILEQVAKKIAEFKEKGAGQIEKLKKGLDFTWDPFEYLEGAVEEGIQSAIKKAAKKALAKLLGSKAAGGMYSILNDLYQLADVLSKVKTLEDLKRAWNLFMLAVIKKTAQTKLGIDPTAESVDNYIYFCGPDWEDAVAKHALAKATPKMFCWEPEKDGEPGEGKWCEEELKFTEKAKTSYGASGEGKTSISFMIEDMDKTKKGKGKCKTPCWYFHFSLKLPKPDQRKCKGTTCYIVMDVTVTYDGQTQEFRFLAGAFK